ncbi:hypothetical protein Ancab_026895 [Ancistrocladus abbreviatus]
MALSLFRAIAKSSSLRCNTRGFNIVTGKVLTTHTAKWMQKSTIKQWHEDETIPEKTWHLLSSLLLTTHRPQAKSDRQTCKNGNKPGHEVTASCELFGYPANWNTKKQERGWGQGEQKLSNRGQGRPSRGNSTRPPTDCPIFCRM